MARSRVTTSLPEMSTLTFQEAQFVVEYTKDWDHSRAAMVAGYSPERGTVLRKDERVQTAINMIMKRRLEDSDIDAEWMLYELVDNHLLARQRGNLSASNTALGLIGKMSLVDAYAEEKVALRTDEELVQRLVRGRQRARDRAEGSTDSDEEVTFL